MLTLDLVLKVVNDLALDLVLEIALDPKVDDKLNLTINLIPKIILDLEIAHALALTLNLVLEVALKLIHEKPSRCAEPEHFLYRLRLISTKFTNSPILKANEKHNFVVCVLSYLRRCN